MQTPPGSLPLPSVVDCGFSEIASPMALPTLPSYLPSEFVSGSFLHLGTFLCVLPHMLLQICFVRAQHQNHTDLGLNPNTATYTSCLTLDGSFTSLGFRFLI